jgi:hypothetical protein
VCALTKSAKQRISSARNPDNKATRPFERIFTDMIKTLPGSPRIHIISDFRGRVQRFHRRLPQQGQI